MKRSKHDREPEREGFADWAPRIRTGRGRVPALLLGGFVVLPALVCGFGAFAIGNSGLSPSEAKAGLGGLVKSFGVGFFLLAIMMGLLARKRWRD